MLKSVTLIGAHSLGHTHIDRSGFGFDEPNVDPLLLNAWDNTPATFDNDYFLKLTQLVSIFDTLKDCNISLTCYLNV